MSINTIVKLLNFLIDRLIKEASRLSQQAYDTEQRADALRLEARSVDAEAKALRVQVSQADRLAGKLVQFIKD